MFTTHVALVIAPSIHVGKAHFMKIFFHPKALTTANYVILTEHKTYTEKK